MARRRRIAVLAAGATTVLAACGSTGTHTQDISPTSSGSSTSSSSATSSPTPTATATSSATSTQGATSVPTPHVTPPAQGAVNDYIANFNADIAASRDPRHADLSFIAKYETGDIRKSTEASFKSMITQGLAWRGSTPNPRVKVKSVISTSVVQLTSCLAIDKANPWEQYTLATGKAAPVPTLSPPPPYLLTIFMKVGPGGVWQIYDVLQTRGSTCAG